MKHIPIELWDIILLYSLYLPPCLDYSALKYIKEKHVQKFCIK